MFKPCVHLHAFYPCCIKAVASWCQWNFSIIGRLTSHIRIQDCLFKSKQKCKLCITCTLHLITFYLLHTLTHCLFYISCRMHCKEIWGEGLAKILAGHPTVSKPKGKWFKKKGKGSSFARQSYRRHNGTWRPPRRLNFKQLRILKGHRQPKCLT
jgi:hypothetical protein